MGMAPTAWRRTIVAETPTTGFGAQSMGEIMAPTMNRLQLGRRIHQLLVREIGHEIEVERLLAEPRYARDVLLVCDAVPGGELAPLADLFREATQLAEGAGRVPGHTPQPNEWARDTSGFGVTQPPPVAKAPPAPGAERRRSWLQRFRDSL